MNAEAQLAHHVILWLRDLHWKVYQEVQMYPGIQRADIVAVQGGRYWVIECKVSMGLTVLGQCLHWHGFANYVSAATAPCRTKGVWKIAEHCGVGWLSVCEPGVVTEHVAPRLFRNPVGNGRLSSFRRLADAVESMPADHETYGSAGNNCGQFYSPFKQTCREVRDFVVKNPGCSLKELVSKVDTHYHSTATAISCLAAWIKQGKVPGVECQHNGHKLELYPREIEVPNEEKEEVEAAAKS